LPSSFTGLSRGRAPGCVRRDLDGGQVSEKLTFTVPLVPPSLNHYKTRFRNGNTVVTKEARAFKAAVATYARGEYVRGKSFHVALRVVLPPKARGDVDNFPKLVLDGLADAGVFRDKKGKVITDAHVSSMLVVRDCHTRPECGSTEIEVSAI